ncbi:hypothetical protein Clacol_008818 [Clathrus columnatus]|uniref:F-box domain-containing protein n=1 Tax=Clathrus columnatus TaxID=1419009 RepID=A0AAV5AM39_9AGAM|nr:hypothetical protein Clacol_008818 [Clathrus columnatus]
MSPSLPSDVWLNVIHFIGEDKCSLQTLSSVNNFIRDLALPALFHTIQLVIPNSNQPKTLHVFQEKLLRRIRGISLTLHISSHIRYLKLVYWRPSHENHVYSAYFKQLDIQDHISKLTPIIYQLIVDLIPNLPRLYRLDLKECCLTQGSLASICRSKSLEFLRLNGFVLKSGILDPDTKVLTFSNLHILEYCPGIAPGPSNNNMIASLLRPTSRFTVLCLPLSDISLLLHNTTGKLLQLQKLTIFERFPSNNNANNNEEIYSLLSLTPDLRELHLIGKIYGNIHSILPSTIVPRLESLTATPVIANCIASGRALNNIHILSFPQHTFLKSYNAVIKEATNVSYDSMLADPRKEFSHLSHMFPNASTLRITAEISDAILSVLPKFSRLRQCGVFDTGRCPTDMDRDRACCPIGRRDNPTYRCHPTIQDLQILSWYRWRWISKDGWRLVTVKYSPFDFWDNVFFD